MTLEEFQRKGGKARAARMAPEARRKAASEAAQARWQKSTPAQRKAHARRMNEARWGTTAEKDT